MQQIYKMLEDTISYNVFWVRDTLVCCVQMNPELLNDPRLPPVHPTVRVLHRGAQLARSISPRGLCFLFCFSIFCRCVLSGWSVFVLCRRTACDRTSSHVINKLKYVSIFVIYYCSIHFRYLTYVRVTKLQSQCFQISYIYTSYKSKPHYKWD